MNLCITARYEGGAATVCQPLPDVCDEGCEALWTVQTQEAAKRLARLQAGTQRLRFTEVTKHFVVDECSGYWEEPECQTREVEAPKHERTAWDMVCDWVMGIVFRRKERK